LNKGLKNRVTAREKLEICVAAMEGVAEFEKRA